MEDIPLWIRKSEVYQNFEDYELENTELPIFVLKQISNIEDFKKIFRVLLFWRVSKPYPHEPLFYVLEARNKKEICKFLTKYKNDEVAIYFFNFLNLERGVKSLVKDMTFTKMHFSAFGKKLLSPNEMSLFPKNAEWERMINNYVMLTYSEKYFGEDGFFEKMLREIEIFNECNYDENYCYLYPGESPGLFWFLLLTLYPKYRGYKNFLFPISGIRDEGGGKRQDNLFKEYMESILGNLPKNTKFIYIDFLFKRRTETQLKKTLKQMNFTKEVITYNIGYSRNCDDDKSRFAPKYFLGKDNEVEMDYTRINILLYASYFYAIGDRNVDRITLNSHYSIVPFINKNVNLCYLDIDEVKFMNDVLCQDLYALFKFNDVILEAKKILYIEEAL